MLVSPEYISEVENGIFDYYSNACNATISLVGAMHVAEGGQR